MAILPPKEINRTAIRQWFKENEMPPVELSKESGISIQTIIEWKIETDYIDPNDDIEIIKKWIDTKKYTSREAASILKKNYDWLQARKRSPDYVPMKQEQSEAEKLIMEQLVIKTEFDPSWGIEPKKLKALMLVTDSFTIAKKFGVDKETVLKKATAKNINIIKLRQPLRKITKELLTSYLEQGLSIMQCAVILGVRHKLMVKLFNQFGIIMPNKEIRNEIIKRINEYGIIDCKDLLPTLE